MRTRTIRRLLTCITVCCLAAAFSASAQATETTFTPYYKFPFQQWMGKAMSAATVESQQLARHWRNTHTAYWDVDGVPIYIGTPKQLDRMGQRVYERALQQVCAYGAHQYTTKDAATPSGIRSRSRIVILTAGSWSCINHGRYHTLSTKLLEVTLVHEVLEYLVDPKLPVFIRKVSGHRAEVCDPVDTKYAYDHYDGAWIPDFVYPSYFNDGSFPYDYFGELTKGVSSKRPFHDAVRRALG